MSCVSTSRGVTNLAMNLGIILYLFSTNYDLVFLVDYTFLNIRSASLKHQEMAVGFAVVEHLDVKLLHNIWGQGLGRYWDCTIIIWRCQVKDMNGIIFVSRSVKLKRWLMQFFPGVPSFYLNYEVEMNAERICRATHADSVARAACTFLALLVSAILQVSLK